MMKLTPVNLDQLMSSFKAKPSQIRFVAAQAMTSAMKDVRAAEYETMRSVFDQPTNYTMNSIQVTPAKKQELRTELGYKEFSKTPAWKYLGPQVDGGQRKHKRFERALIARGILRESEYCVPTDNVAKDSSGNVSSGQIVRILSALGANPIADSNTRRRPKRSNRKRNLDYFVLRGTRAHDGIYQRQERRAVPILLFVRTPSYKRRFPFREKARTVFTPAFHRHFHTGFQRFVVNDKR